MTQNDLYLTLLFKSRFGDMKECPNCGKPAKFHRIKSRASFGCQWCGYQLSPKAGTIFEKSTTPLKDWFYAMRVLKKENISALELQRRLGVTYKTAWRMKKEITLMLEEDNEYTKH